MRRLFRNALLFCVVLPLRVSEGQSVTTGRELLAVDGGVMRTLGKYLTGQFGTSVIYESEMRCANRALCRAEGASLASQSEARGRRAMLQHSLLASQPSVRLGVRKVTVTCCVTDCQVRGASRFIQVKEPVIRGDTAFVSLHVYENAAKTYKIRSYLVRILNSRTEGWSVLAMQRLGFTKDA